MTSKAVVALLQQEIDATHASTAARDAWASAVAKERDTSKTVGTPLLAALKHYVAAVFGTNSDEYRAFGFQPPKPRTKSPTASVIGAAKNAATRKARNTMGSKQRLGVIGAIPSTLVLPVGIAPVAAPVQSVVTTTVTTPAQPAASTPAAGASQPSTAVTNGTGGGGGGNHQS